MAPMERAVGVVRNEGSLRTGGGFVRAIQLVVSLIGAAWLAAAAGRASAQTYGIDFRNTLMPASGTF